MFLNEPPIFVNAEGTKWWVDKGLTHYAQKPDRNDVKLDVVCYIVETIDGYRARVLVSEAQEIIEEDQTIDGMGVKIDIRKFLKHDLEKNP